MTETANPGINQYIGTGAVATYAFTFRTFASTDLQFWEQATGAEPVQKTLNVDYTVTGSPSYTGGTVTRVAGNLPSGTRLTIKRVLPIQQTTDLRNQGEYLAETQEAALDKAAIISKQLDEKLGRAILAPDTDGPLGKLPADRALQLLGFDAAKNPIAAQPTGSLVSAAMQPVVAAAALAAARAAMGPWGDALVTATGSTTARDLAHRAADILNIKDFGAISGGPDCSAAFNLAFAAAPSDGATLYIPDGKWTINSPLVFNGKQINLRGQSTRGSIILIGFATGDAITISNQVAGCSTSDLSIECAVLRTVGSYALVLDSCTNPFISRVAINGAIGSGIKTINCSLGTYVGIRIDLNGSNTGIGWYMQACSGSVTACHVRTDHAAALVIKGNATGIRIANCGFTGGGSERVFTNASITSTAGNFTVTTTGIHGFLADDFIVIKGSTPSAYNGQWRVTSVTATTIVVTSTINPGTASVAGTTGSPQACVLISNENGPVNESQINNCLIEAGYANEEGSIGILFDGMRDPGFSELQGWTISNVFFDYGKTGIAFLSAAAGSGRTVSRINLTNVIFQSELYGCYASGVGGLQISNVAPGARPRNVSGTTAEIYLFAASNANKTQGVNINSCSLGYVGTFDESMLPVRGAKYGIVLDGAGMQDISIIGNQIYGITAPLLFLNSALASTSRWTIKGNTGFSGAAPFGWASQVPTIASAATITLPDGNDTVIISGSATITTINGGWVGRMITILWGVGSTAVTNTGGNVLNAAGNSPGKLSQFIYDGTNWYVR